MVDFHRESQNAFVSTSLKFQFYKILMHPYKVLRKYHGNLNSLARYHSFNYVDQSVKNQDTCDYNI